MTGDEACREYAAAMAEAERLTTEIAGIVCPQESEQVYPDRANWFELKPSHFAEAKRRRINTPWPDDDDDGRPLRLSEIARRVADCPECSKLCRLIAERRKYRRRAATYKGVCRKIGNRILTTETT